MQFDFFPSRQVSLYMIRLFITRTLAVLALLVIVLQALDLLSESGRILAQPGNGQAALLHYVGLRAPQIIDRFLPFSVLLGTLITLATLNANSEIISMKAAGLSAHQILAPLVAASLVVASAAFLFNDRVVVDGNRALNAWEDADFGPVRPEGDMRGNMWVRQGSLIVGARQVTGRGPETRLEGVTLYVRRGGGIQQLVELDAARPDGNGWRAEGPARRFDVGTAAVTQVANLRFGSGIAPDRFVRTGVDPDTLSFAALSAAIEGEEASGRPTEELRANLWHKLSGPLSAVLMPLLAAVAAFGLARSGQLFVRAVIGMALGFAYFVVDNLALALGNLGAYPPLAAAWSPFFLFLLIGETVLIRTEE